MSEDAVWEALARALSGEYEIVARLGLGNGGAPVYLARELVTDSFVALRLPDLISGQDAKSGLEIVRQLDGSLPEIETKCPHCAATIRHWSRHCSSCGHDIAGMTPRSSGQTREQLGTLARNVARHKYQILGDMARADGGGAVYFGRDLTSGEIVGLQLESGRSGRPTMNVARFAGNDPSIQIPETRGASPATPVFVAPARAPQHPTVKARGSAATPAKSGRALTIAVAAALLVFAAMMTCRAL